MITFGNISNKHIALIEEEDIISDDIKVAETMNTLFAKSILNLDIIHIQVYIYTYTRIHVCPFLT